MRLNPDVAVSEWMKAVQQCERDVYFFSEEGDQLNLKSALSQFLFLMLQGKPELLYSGKVACDDADFERLRPYVLE